MQTRQRNPVVYLGSAATLRPGDRLPAGLPVTADPAQALANAWRLAGTGGRRGTPHVYELAGSRHRLVVLADLAITADLAGRAMAMTGRGVPGRA